MVTFMIITLLMYDFYQQTSENRKKQEKAEPLCNKCYIKAAFRLLTCEMAPS